MTHVHDTRVNVSKLFEAEQPGAVGRVIEGEGGGGIDGNGSGLGRWVGLLAWQRIWLANGSMLART